MEKLKDFIHDTTDILLALVIVVVMSGVVVLNLGDWFNIGVSASPAENSPIVANDPISKTNNDDVIDIIDEDSDMDEEAIDEDSQESQQQQQEEQEEQQPQDQPSTPPVIVVEIKSITIPEGSFGANIARILHDNGLIDSTADFIKTAEDLNLASRLNSGTFNIPTDASLEDMVRIIARVQR